MPKFEWIRKVLVLGSGAIKIGEAAEFDYSGSQCLKALKEEGIETVLINPNVATIQTDPRLANKVYLLPVEPHYVEEVIKREEPDGILLGFGGQTALNCGVQLAKEGILEKYGVEVLGTPISAIEATEDRELFRQAMIRAGIPVLRSKSATSVEEVLKAADEIGYPVILRVAYTLGGGGSGVAFNAAELRQLAAKALAQSIISQVLVEEYIGKWKEIEYEVMRDRANNCITVCNMENFDPMGIHTGDSIVVAPSQTLTNKEYHLLRSSSIKVIQSLGIVGECNIQWALHPKCEEFRAIEVNARMSRSSALASKATGYPLAYIAAKLAIGYLLPELINKVTGITTACFEPSLDYVVVKIPRWDFQKFNNVDRRIGTQMKSVGEVMAIGRCFEEALQKAVRMLDIGKAGLVGNGDDDVVEPIELIKKALVEPTDERLFKIVKAIKIGIPIEEIYSLSGIDPWFLYKIKNIIEMEKKLKSLNIESEEAYEIIKEAKRLGFSDKQIAHYLQTAEVKVREWRKRKGIVPVVKRVDTLAAEWPAKTNYLYLTYGGDEDDVNFETSKNKAVVLGAGVFRIGSSVEFDWCAVNTVWFLKKYGVEEVIMVNYNPETVSTDYDVSDKLYFEELTLERVLDIYEKEKPMGVVVSVGGQIPNNIALKLANLGVKLLGTAAESIDKAEDRSKFSQLLEDLKIPQPKWSKMATINDALKFAEEIGYPVLVRPSYVLSGSGMKIANSSRELKEYLEVAAKVSPEHPVVVSEFIQDAKEVDVDGVADGEEVFIGAVIEHVENAGVHSGDSVMCIPPQTLQENVVQKIEEYTRKIAQALKIKGPFNIQYLIKDCEVYVIECNLRASRSMPFVSKTIGINLMELSSLAMLGKKLRELKISRPEVRHVGVKVPQFSFTRLIGADPLLNVEMQSTGEVACLGEDFADALIKALQSAGFNIPTNGGYVMINVEDPHKAKEISPIAMDLWKMGFRIYADKNIFNTLTDKGISDAKILHDISDIYGNPNPIVLLSQRKIDFVISISAGNAKKRQNGYAIRRTAVDFNIPVITTVELASFITEALKRLKNRRPTIQPLLEYNFSSGMNEK
ncbi:MAG: carbamoyl-phosphate synthase (glutamine-hydrolyzing) large subunit [Candidatus Bathyarchaeia archaeon]